MFQEKKIEVETLVPANYKGSSNDSFACREYKMNEEAFSFFKVLINRLLSVSRWSEYAGGENFVFELTDAEGHLKNDPPEINDKIRIQLPGFKYDAGNGYDWVEVSRIEEKNEDDVQFFLLEVSPCECPYSSEDKTAHFYWENSTNTFIIAQRDNTVQVSIHGRNEVSNTEEQTIKDKVRNFVMASASIIAGAKSSGKYLPITL